MQCSPPEAESLQDRSWLTKLNFAPEPDAAVRKEYDEKRRRLDELDVELGVLEREVPHLHNKLTWQRAADPALRAEYDTKRARWDQVDRELAVLRNEVMRLHQRVGWNGTLGIDREIAEYRVQHAAALAAADR
jgi:chromosome segregation ATPase